MNSYIVEFTRRKIERCQVGEDDRWRYQGQLHQQQKEEEKSIRKKGQRLPAVANKAGGRRMLVGGCPAEARQQQPSSMRSSAACSGTQCSWPTRERCAGGAPRRHMGGVLRRCPKGARTIISHWPVVAWRATTMGA